MPPQWFAAQSLPAALTDALRPTLLEARAARHAICEGTELAPSFRAAAEFANADQEAQGFRGLLSAHGPEQGGGGSALRRVLGRLHDAAGAIVKPDDHDDDRTGQRGSSDLSLRVGPGLRRKRRHPGTGWLVALVGVRVPLSSCALPTIFVGALVNLLGGGRIAARGGRARRLCTCALRTDDSATGHGRVRRELASLGPTSRPWCARSRLGVRRVRHQDAGCRWARDDRGDAVVDGIHRHHPFGLERQPVPQWRRSARETGGRLHPVQSDRHPDRAGSFPVCSSAQKGPSTA
jgi:hypothetical protein